MLVAASRKCVGSSNGEAEGTLLVVVMYGNDSSSDITYKTFINK